MLANKDHTTLTRHFRFLFLTLGICGWFLSSYAFAQNAATLIQDNEGKTVSSLTTYTSIYTGRILEYYNEKNDGLYKGADVSVNYPYSSKVRLSAGLSYTETYGADEFFEGYKDFSDLGVSASLPEVTEIGGFATLTTSVRATLPTSEHSMKHKKYGAISNRWALVVPTALVTITPSLSLSKNFYKYNQQNKMVRIGDQIGSPNIDYVTSGSVFLSKSFSFGLSASVSYGISRIYPYIGQHITRNNSSAQLSWTVKGIIPYVAVRTSANQLNYNKDATNFALYERNRSRGEAGLSVSF